MISDELREFADTEVLTPIQISTIKHVAKRIDAEMFELPKDKDGMPIHVGDTVYLNDGRKAEVSRIGIGMGVDGIYNLVFGDNFSVRPEHVSHERQDSWERIADELDEQAGSLTKDGYTWQEDAIHDFADRIRKLGEAKEYK